MAPIDSNKSIELSFPASYTFLYRSIKAPIIVPSIIKGTPDTDFTLTLLNNPDIPAENNLGVGLSFDLKNNVDIIKTFGNISIVGKNTTTSKEDGNLSINLIKNGNINNNVLSLNSDGILSITRLVETSDLRLKENIKLTNLEDSYNKIMNITPFFQHNLP